MAVGETKKPPLALSKLKVSTSGGGLRAYSITLREKKKEISVISEQTHTTAEQQTKDITAAGRGRDKLITQILRLLSTEHTATFSSAWTKVQQR